MQREGRLPRTPAVAAALDFFIWGVGHAYVGRRKAIFFPWVIWTLGFAVWNIIGAVIWENSARCACDFFTITYVNEILFSVPSESVNWAAVIAFWFIPTLIVGGWLALDVFTTESAKIGAPVPAFLTGLQARLQRNPAPQQAAAQTVVYCRSCGAANTPGDAFCANCGAPMNPAPAPAQPAVAAAPAAPAPAAPAQQTKVCPNCGTPNPIGNAFCKRCGTKFS